MNELSRKRPHADDGDLTVAKKRVLTGTNGTPQVNGHSDQTEDEQLFQANLEKFRKEAIWRRMKHYQRENERNSAKIEDLERQKTRCEANVAAMAACWAQSDDLSPSNIQAKDEDTLPEFEDALGRTATATEALVHKLIESGGSEGSIAWKKNHFEELQQSQTECAALRSQLGLLKKQLDDCTSDKDKYHAELLAHPQKATSKAATPREGETPTTTTASSSEDKERKPSSPSIPSQGSTPAPESRSLSLLPESVKLWENRIEQLEAENLRLKQELFERPEKRAIHHTNSDELSGLRRCLTSTDAQLTEVQEELKQVLACREEWKQSVLAAQESVIDNMRAMMVRRDNENTRLREQRDQSQAELLERKQKDGIKWNAQQELKSLVDIQNERISAFKSELSRCKARLAAKEGDGDLLRFFLQGKPEEEQLIEELKAQKADAEVRAQAAEAALSKIVQGEPSTSAEHATLVKLQVEAEEKVVRLTRELEELRTVFGVDALTVPPDVSKLNDQIRAQGKELERLRLLQEKSEQGEADLYKTINDLSDGHDALLEKVKDKVFQLHYQEEKLSKAIVEKAKSENKFYAAMRDKEALEAERKTLIRTQEKWMNMAQTREDQVGVIDKLRQTLQDELFKEKAARERGQRILGNVEGMRLDAEARLKGGEEACKAQTELLKAEAEKYTKGLKALRLKEAEWDSTKKQLEEQVQKLKQDVAAGAAHKHDRHTSKNGRDEEYQSMRSLLMCSTCDSNFRSVIVTKCMHTFCKPCIDARISTRQRKCPACGVAFAQSDVSTLYMQ
ncbi:hypothetical protein DFP72DRAFT_874675 [Ephemerocybe angulata]|uniref:E3 ubiquitin protein ligase n=1 Tax=Ephemerocybe angulata TaxID=980116 RepID=A0A8H6MFC5_9AGAR|nr:hypothetical protein DFP72DRAFT_874675 [Tulosesus angulatus]